MKNKTINERASVLMHDSKISARVQELKDQIAQELVEITAYSLLEHLKELDEMKQLALEKKGYVGKHSMEVENPDIATALRAVQCKGQVTGLYEKTLILQQFNTNIGAINNIEQLVSELPELEFEDAQI